MKLTKRQFEAITFGNRPPESEKEFQKQVIDLAHLYGWRVAHFRPVQLMDGRWITPVEADGEGWPDLAMAKKGRVIISELKTDIGQLSAAQELWKVALGSHVWRPKDFEQIKKLLAG